MMKYSLATRVRLRVRSQSKTILFAQFTAQLIYIVQHFFFNSEIRITKMLLLDFIQKILQYKILLYNQLKMDWNQCSDDSWLNDDSSQQQQKVQKEQPKTSIQQQSPQQKQEVTQTESDQKSEQKKQKEVPKQKIQKGEQKNQGKKFPTDNQLLQQYESGKVQDSQRLKIINCFEKEEIQMLESLDKNKQLRLRQFKNKKNCYAAKFWSKEDLIKFIKEKIQKRYKFKIGIYVESQNEKKWKAEKQKQRTQLKAKQNQQKQKEKKQHKDQKSKIQYRAKDEEPTKGKQQDKKHFRKQKDEESENYKKRQNKQSTKQYKQKGSKPQSKNTEYKDQRRQHPHHKDYKGQQKKHKGPIKSLKRQNQRLGKVEVLSQEASPSEVCQWIKYQKISSQFKQFTLLAPGRFNVYMEKISQQIHKNLSFGLISDISQEQCEQKADQLFQFVYHENTQPKHIKRALHGVFIDKVSQQNFDTVQKLNTHIIGFKNDLSAQTNFDQKQYLELFKKNYHKIVTKWQKWVFLAYNKNIAKLLRLSAGLKKSLPKNPFTYEVGVYQKLPFVRVQICELNKTKYKVDTSVINSHLQD